MTQEHPITPPPELVREWTQYQGFESPEILWQQIATQAARWGADQELEACCEWFSKEGWNKCHPKALRAARRPKSLSKKERALDSLWKCYEYIDDDLYEEIKEAIESLPDEQ